MKILGRTLAALEVTLLFPAVVFMAALFVRSIQPVQYQPAHLAQQIVDWYAARPHLGLWILLIALPITVAATGTSWLVRSWKSDATLRDATNQLRMIFKSHASALIVAAATSVAAAILAIVVFHVLTD